jgi:hypothetical protein
MRKPKRKLIPSSYGLFDANIGATSSAKPHGGEGEQRRDRDRFK